MADLKTDAPAAFLSAPPRVRLVKAFTSPFANTVATARTCYSSKGIIEDADVGPRAAQIAGSIYQAGHHTTFQHAHFQFALENVSRQCIWAFLHAHPFYNSEQVSQRYVTIQPDAFATPPLEGEALDVYEGTVRRQVEIYRRLNEMLRPLVAREFHKRFRRSERMAKSHERAIGKKCQELARYVAPVAMHAYMYHTVSAITLLRYWRMCRQGDAPLEQEWVARSMIEAVLEHDPDYAAILEPPLPRGAAPEAGYERLDPAEAALFRARFDARLEGRVSKLVDWKSRAEETLAESVREVVGATSESLSDDEAIRLALDPERNRLLGESLNVTTLDKIARTMAHPAYTFRKKLSHTADSQDQRHRMTPGSRPSLAMHITGEPDYIMPPLLEEDDSIRREFVNAMEAAWEAMGRLKALGVSDEFALYLAPNAVAIRFSESSDLLNLHHKHRMRLCYNAQEEIWRASLDEAEQVRAIHPRIGAWLLPPCSQRLASRTRPLCPEGDRYCGVRVWTMDLEEYERLI